MVVLICSFCCLCEFCSTFLCQSQIHHILFVLQIIFDHGGFRRLYLGTCQDNGTILLQFFYGFIQNILRAVERVVLRTVRTFMGNKIQGTGFSQLFQNLVGICHSRDFHIDPVCALFVYLGFRAVLLHTFL